VFGGQKGIARFNQHLAWHLPLVCLCSRDNEPSGQIPYKIIPELPVGKGQFINPACWNQISKVAKEEQVSHIIIEHPYHGIAAVKAKKATGAKLIVHSHNIESERFQEVGAHGWRILKSYEKWVHRKADLSLFKTNQDMDFAIKNFGLAPDKCMVVPYGIDIPKPIDKETTLRFIRHKHDIAPGEKIFLFAGTLDYAPNADAVENIYKEIAPRLSKTGLPYKIIICGRNKFPEFHYLNEFYHPAVIRAGEVEDIDHYFTVADTFINPVLFGGGTQTKNMDALSHHCNVVCFARMTGEGMSVLLWNKLFSCQLNDWAGFVEQMQIAAHQQSETPALFFEKYNWKTIVAELNEHL
jgi:hypothetical protein